MQHFIIPLYLVSRSKSAHIILCLIFICDKYILTLTGYLAMMVGVGVKAHGNICIMCSKSWSDTFILQQI